MNTQIFFFFYNFAHQSKILDQLIVFLAVYFPYLVIIAAGVFILMHHEVLQAEAPFVVFMEKKKEILMLFFSGIFAYILSQVLKYLIRSPRPFDVWAQIHPLFSETGYGFPSGHATFFMALAFSIFFLPSSAKASAEHGKKAGYWFMLFALLIGLARIAAGVHFPGDILGGFLLGAFISYSVAFFRKNVYPHT